MNVAAYDMIMCKYELHLIVNNNLFSATSYWYYTNNSDEWEKDGYCFINIRQVSFINLE